MAISVSASGLTTTKVNNTLASVEKRITKVELNESVITQLVTGKGGLLRLPTANFPELNALEQQYWPFHSPYGAPGDELWVVEDYRIVKVCSTNEGCKLTLEFRDSTQVVLDSKFNMALTPEGTWIPAASMPPDLSRLKLLLQSVACSGDYSEWQFTTVHLNPITL